MELIKNTDSVIWTLSKAEILALCEFASKDETRPHLNAICLDPCGGKAITTDGHTLLVLALNAGAPTAPTDGVDESWLASQAPIHKTALLTRANALQAAKACLKEETVVITVPLDPNSPMVIAIRGKFGAISAVSFTVKRLNAQFPPYEQVVPKRREAGDVGGSAVVGVNCEYLARLQLVAKALEARGMGGKLAIGGAYDPIRVDFDGHETSATVVIMPMRI